MSRPATANTKAKAPARTLKAIRKEAPRQDRDTEALALPPAKRAWKSPYVRPLKAVPFREAYARLAEIAADFGADATAVADYILWNAVSRWYGRMNDTWGHPKASMLGSDAGSRLRGVPPRAAEVATSQGISLEEFRRQASLVRAKFDEADCPGIFYSLKTTLPWMRESIANRHAL